MRRITNNFAYFSAKERLPFIMARNRISIFLLTIFWIMVILMDSKTFIIRMIQIRFLLRGKLLKSSILKKVYILEVGISSILKISFVIKNYSQTSNLIKAASDSIWKAVASIIVLNKYPIITESMKGLMIIVCFRHLFIHLSQRKSPFICD